MQLHASLDLPGRAAAAARRFLTPIRTPARAAERVVLDAAATRVIATAGGPVTSYAWGAGDATVLLVHGWNGHAGQLRSFVAPLLARGRRVVAFDAPAHGASPGELAHVPAFAAAVEAVVTALGPVSAVIAHSGGAVACARAAARGTPLGPMAWLAPVPSLRRFALAAARAAGLDAPELPAFLAEIEALVEVPFEALELDRLARVRVDPLLIVHDRDDALVPLRSVQQAVASIPAATLRETAGLGHGRVLVDDLVVQEAVAFVVDDRA
jgi:pimeloyl-ACP methyl ester carboxylesterase